MIICSFSSSHFATQIFPIDELLKPYLRTYNIYRVFIVFYIATPAALHYHLNLATQ
jgi:hypothetical protein